MRSQLSQERQRVMSISAVMAGDAEKVLAGTHNADVGGSNPPVATKTAA
jgi:hypothetical protein